MESESIKKVEDVYDNKNQKYFETDFLFNSYFLIFILKEPSKTFFCINQNSQLQNDFSPFSN